MIRDALVTLIPLPSLSNSCFFASERRNLIQKLQSAAPPAIVPRIFRLTGRTFCTVLDPTKLPIDALESTAAIMPPWKQKESVVVPCANSIGGERGGSNISSCCCSTTPPPLKMSVGVDMNGIFITCLSNP